MRTCYDPALESNYQDLLDTADPYHDIVLDDEALYGQDGRWECILQRMPMLCDRDTWGSLDEVPTYHHLEDRPDENSPTFEMWDATKREVAMVYLLDRQALQEKLLTVIWLDNFGECVWWYRVDPDQMLEFEGGIASGCGLNWYWECVQGFDEIHPEYVKGSLLFCS